MITPLNIWDQMDLSTAIAPPPVSIAPTATVTEAIAQMLAGENLCHLTPALERQQWSNQIQRSCLLVLDQQQLVGIITTGDLMHVCAEGGNLARKAIAEVMSSPVQTLNRVEVTDVFVPIQQLQRHHIRHLPLVNDQGNVVGVITDSSLRPLTHGMDVLRLPTAAAAMQTAVHATPSISLAELAQRMKIHKVAAVVIGEQAESLPTEESARVIPVGIVTEHDIVQALGLGLDLATVQAQTIMDRSVVTAGLEMSLWDVQQLMQEGQVNPVVITGNDGVLIGIVTQSQLLTVLNPMTLYPLLEGLMQERSRAMAKQLSRNQLFTQIAAQIHTSLNLQEVLDAAVTGVRSLLQCDRVLVYQFQPDWSGTVVAESVGDGWSACRGEAIDDPCFRDRVAQLYNNGKLIAIDNIHTVGYPDCYRILLEQYQVKANLVVPISVSGQLWGLLIGHHCADYRHWQGEDLTLLNDIAMQLAIAIQQALSHQQLQAELKTRQRVELALQQSRAELQSFFAAMDDVVLILDRNGTYLNIPSTHSNRLYRPSQELLGRSLREVFPEEQADLFLSCIQATLATGQTQSCEYGLLIGDTERWFNAQCSPLTTETVLMVARDISDRKHMELELQQQRTLLRMIVDTTPNKIFVKDRDGRFLLVNRAIAEALHTPVENLIGRYDRDFIADPDLVAQFLQENQTVIAKQQSLFIPEEKISFDNSEQWFQWQKHPITLPGSNTLAVLGIGVNITSHKQAQAILRQYERVVSATLDGIALVDRNYIYRLINQVYLNWYEKQYEEIVGHSVAELLGERVFQTLVQPCFDRCLTGDIQQYEAWFTYPNGERRFVRVTYSPYVELDGSITGVLSSIHDLTAIKQTEVLLEIQNSILERIAKAEPLPDILNALVYAMELQLVGALCSIMLSDRDGTLHSGAAPNLPDAYLQAIDGIPIAEGVGSCGTAAFRRKMVVVTNIATDPLWQDYCKIALIHGLNACWSIPICAGDGNLLGVFGIYYQEIRSPEPHELDTATLVANIAGIAIEQEQSRQALEQLNRELEQRVEERTLALQSSEERWQLALRGTNDGIWDWNVITNQVFFSSRWKAMRGYQEEKVGDRLEEWSKGIHPDDYGRVMAGVAAHFAGQTEFFEMEYRVRHTDGSYFWILDRGQALRDLSGKVVRMSGSETNISDRKNLQQEQQRLIAILEASTDYIAIIDTASEKIVWNNAAIKQICGIESSVDVTQRTLSDYHPQWVLTLLEQQAVPAAIATGSWLGETALLDAEGQEVPVSQLLLAHKSPQGEVEFFSTIMRDMRVHKAYEHQLRQTNAELMRATRLKDEFLANMSHELRTPLNAILGLSEGLQEEVFGSLHGSQKKAIATIERSGQHLLDLINDILEVSKIAAGKLELELSPVSIPHLCNSSLAFVKQQALKKRIQLTTAIPLDLGNIIADERRLRQVLINLLTNAVKFTPQGGRIRLEVKQQEIGTGEQTDQDRLTPVSWLRLAVIDTGIGIAAADQDKLFQPFIQLDSSLNRQYEGTGLGLALVKQIVELHGGFVSLESEIGQGSCFTVHLPFRHTSIEEDPDRDPSPVNPLPLPPAAIAPSPLILLVEDNEDNIGVLFSYLDANHYRLIVAHNGQEAIDLTRHHHPDLILMDIQMPGMNGLDAIRQIRADARGVAIPIIALTALAMEGDRQCCLDAGATDYLAKPVQLKTLSQMIQTLLC